jgi:integrase
VTQLNVTTLPKTRLTDQSIARLTIPPDGRVCVRDTLLPHLVLLAGQRARTWYLHATMHRKTHRVRLGPWPILSTDEARHLCLEALRRLWRGEAPTNPAPTTTPAAAAAAAALAAPTLANVLGEYLGSRRLSASATADLRSVINKHAAAWADKPVDALEPRAVAQRYRLVALTSPAPAQRLLGALSALTKYAHAAHGVGDPNLIVRTRALLGATKAVEARDVIICDAKQGDWHKAVMSEGPAVSRYLRALMLTGLRANELRRAPPTRWDAGDRAWCVETTKNGKPHALPCGPALQALIEEEASAAMAVASKKAVDPRLFDVSVKAYRGACERVSTAIGIDWHLHDLRRTFATAATRTGIDSGMVKRLMNHSAGGDVTAKHYVRLSVEDLRPAMERVELHLVALWAGRASAEAR